MEKERGAEKHLRHRTRGVRPSRTGKPSLRERCATGRLDVHSFCNGLREELPQLRAGSAATARKGVEASPLEALLGIESMRWLEKRIDPN